MKTLIQILESIDYKTWKRKNVTYRGIKSTDRLDSSNGVWGSWGKGLYTCPASNKSMAKQYGKLYFVVNAIPSRPKVVNSLNEAEIWRQNLAFDFCKKHGFDDSHAMRTFEEKTTIEDEMKKQGYDGFVIKGREMVHYEPKDVKYFETERQLEMYFNDTVA